MRGREDKWSGEGGVSEEGERENRGYVNKHTLGNSERVKYRTSIISRLL